MKWKIPKDEHIIYEALSAIADERIILTSETTAKSTSTSGNKSYTITYDRETNSIMSDDNMAFYRGEVSYPMVAFLIMKNIIEYDEELLQYFKGIKWKDINQKNKNDYMKSVEEVLNNLKSKGVDIENIKMEVKKIYKWVLGLELRPLGDKVVPPKAY